MNILKITLLGSAMLFSGAAFAATAPATSGFGEPAAYAQVASPAAPADVTVMAQGWGYYGRDDGGGYHGGGYGD